MKNAPRLWDQLEIEPFLESSGFQNLEFLSKKWDRVGTSWIFRGSRIDSETYLQLFFEGNVGDSAGKFLVCELMARDRRTARNTKLQNEFRVSLKPNKVFDLTKNEPQDTKVQEEDVVATMLDEDASKGDDDMGEPNEGEKRPAEVGFRCVYRLSA